MSGVDQKNDNKSDAYFMSLALAEADKAYREEEVPVGAVLVRDDEVIGRGWNRPIDSHDPTAHAEIMAIRSASLKEQNYRLPGVTLYVTIEPCLMCVGAIIHARISKVVYGAKEPRAGALESHPYDLERDCWNHRFEISGGVMAEECGVLMRRFFKERRNGVC